VFGKKEHLVFDGSSYTWSSEIPTNCVIVGSPKKDSKSISSICELLDMEPPSLSLKEVDKSFKQLGFFGPIPSALTHRKDEFKKLLNVAIETSILASDNLESLGYMETFLSCQEVLRGMSRASVDYPRLLKVIEGSGSAKNNSLIRSFETDSDGIMRKAVYSNTSTTTGRMTIESGPQILTAPKIIRNCIQSKFKNGKICQIDFVSLEPRLGRIMADASPKKDIYQDFGDLVFSGKLTRNQVKKVMLCAIYGAGFRTLSELLPDGMSPRVVVKKAKEYLNFDNITRKKKDELKKFGYMQNCFGRPVKPSSDRDSLVYNNWLQSSAVDVALLGFKEIIDSLKDLKSDPIFLIHDALLIDVHPEDLKLVQKIGNDGVTVEGIGYFPLSYSTFSDE
tara:strand:+ start:829 stop:2007 length:1179 start_codon:yes stop_codon:yes gene_type:complete